jgi:hypothetical protein
MTEREGYQIYEDERDRYRVLHDSEQDPLKKRVYALVVKATANKSFFYLKPRESKPYQLWQLTARTSSGASDIPPTLELPFARVSQILRELNAEIEQYNQGIVSVETAARAEVSSILDRLGVPSNSPLRNRSSYDVIKKN